MGKTLQNLDAVQRFFHDVIIHLENISDIPYIKKGFIKVMIGKSCHKHKTMRNKGLTWVLSITLTMIHKISGHSTTSSSQTFTQMKKCQWNNECEKIFNKAKGIIYTTQFTHVSIQACCRWF